MSKLTKRLRINMTDAERRLWRHLRNRQISGYYFRRQSAMGKYVLDFVCHEAKLIIEVDGGQHAERIDQDDKRTQWLNSQGYKVIRFWNNEVLDNIEGVISEIRFILHRQKTPSP